jgi:UDP-arabinose 4-epimerase
MESLAAQSSTGSRPTLLVTGGAGYIGSHACKQLDRAGFEPVTFDNLARGHRELVKWGPLEVGDLADVCRLIEVVERYRPVAVMHFAALAYVGESVREPLEYYRNNVAGSANLLQAMQRMEQPLIIFSSTCATYGEPDAVPIREDHPQRPVNPYGRSKLMVEQMIADMARAHGYGYVNLRYFNADGADPDGETGELHEPETHLIPLALQAAAGHGPQLQVFGEDYPTPDGTCIRDYIHVTDLADVHVLSLQHLLGGGDSASLNLANGNGFSVREVLEAVERVAGRPVPHEVAGRRPGDPPMLVGDATLARRILGWRPRYADLDTIIETAWKFDKVAMLQYGRSG